MPHSAQTDHLEWGQDLARDQLRDSLYRGGDARMIAGVRGGLAGH